MLKIVIAPDEVLTTAVKPVSDIDARIKKIVKQMEETLIAQRDPEGVGLAANQVGIALSIFIMRPDPQVPIEVCINPVVLELSKKPAVALENKSKTAKSRSKKPSLEGCLSIPKIWAPVTRAGKVHLQYQSLDGTLKKSWFTGLSAVIIQHEVDHLAGTLFTSRALAQNSPLYEEVDGKLKKMKA